MADSAFDVPPDGPRSKDNQQKCEVKYLNETHHDGARKIFAKPEKKDDSEVDEARYSEYVLVSIQGFNDENKPTKKRLRINSPQICHALEKEVLFYPSFPDRCNPPFEIESPFALLFHYQHELLQCKDKAPEDEKRHFEILFEYLNKERGSAAADMIEKGLITFDLLWILFKPGQYVYRIEHENTCVFWLQQATEEFDLMRRQRCLRLDCSYTASNATTVGRAAKVIKIHENEFPGQGAREISALSTVPLQYFRGLSVEIKDKARQRAKVYYELERSDRSPLTRKYQGLCQTFNPHAYNEPEWELQTVSIWHM